MLSKSLPDSNAPDSSAGRPENNAAGESIGMLGYSVISNPKQKPARSNADVGITADFGFTEVNEGTSFPTYSDQPETVSAETGS